MKTFQLQSRGQTISRPVTDFGPQGWECWNDHQRRIPMGEILFTEHSIIINKVDLTDLVEDNKDVEGCCGPGGSHFNLFLNDGTPIGKEFSDCWSSHYVEVDRTQITLAAVCLNIRTWVATCDFQGRRVIVERFSSGDESYENYLSTCRERIEWEVTAPRARQECFQSLLFVEVTGTRNAWLSKSDSDYLFNKFLKG